MGDEASVTVRVSQGQLRGRTAVGAWGRQYFAFHGIPYAAPPVGPLRFMPPQPAAAWTGLRDATEERNEAPQTSMLTGQYEGDEDCLFLNVFTPKLPSGGTGSLLPVMFLIHGGGFVALSGNEMWGGPDYLIQHDVIMVSFNYRLGVLGFFSTGDSVVPGNMGLKDQVAALRWVRDNIASFSGDPDNVTIFGYSAGGMSCHALVLSPLAKGLFRRAISQGGVSTGDGIVTELTRDRSFRLAAHLGCKATDSREVADFMRRQPAKLLVDSAMFSRSEEDVLRGITLPFMPTVEPEDPEGGAFLSRSPSDIQSSGDFQQVPFMAGLCAFEGSAYSESLEDRKLPSYFANDLRLLIPTNLRCSEGDKDTVAKQIKEFYFGSREISTDTSMEILMLLGDVVFNYPAVKAAEAFGTNSIASTYLYVFDVTREPGSVPALPEAMSSFMEPITGTTGDEHTSKAAPHCADCQFIFGSARLEYPVPEKDSADGVLIMKMTRLLTNFAKTGQPTSPDLDVCWPRFSADEAAYLAVERRGLSVGHRPFERCTAFWEALYSRYNG